jgi:hypothetical protein
MVAWALGVALVAWAWANEATKKTVTAKNKPSKRCTEHLQNKLKALYKTTFLALKLEQ